MLFDYILHVLIIKQFNNNVLYKILFLSFVHLQFESMKKYRNSFHLN